MSVTDGLKKIKFKKLCYNERVTRDDERKPVLVSIASFGTSI